jgi:hypothetical protein
LPLALFEILCVAIVVVTLAAMTRTTSAAHLAARYAALAVAAWIGEESCIRAYGHYAYRAGWHLRLADVPALVPLIWPLVVLSARDVAAALFPSASVLRRAALVGAIVAVDASLVEVVAVRAGLWSWVEGGHLAVPLIGILGWGFFAFGAELALSVPNRVAPALVILVAPATTHALILASWWAVFRWVLRGDLGVASLATTAAAGLALAWILRRRSEKMDLDVALPRMLAASLFFVLLATTAPLDGPLWLHTAAVAAPYLAATRFALRTRRLRESTSPRA